ncbi:MAG: hypothetical protein KJP23_21215 [Deltaproteobacteria bacterium]|nr:hypothetical protein [Deltaproteobacteria bacterium]
MEKIDLKGQRFGVSVPEDLIEKFKEQVAKENTTIPKLISQFMMNYVDYLDSSFLLSIRASHGQRIKKTYVTMRLPADLCPQFKEKTSREGLKMNAVIEQFILNYVNFLNHSNIISE